MKNECSCFCHALSTYNNKLSCGCCGVCPICYKRILFSDLENHVYNGCTNNSTEQYYILTSLNTQKRLIELSKSKDK